MAYYDHEDAKLNETVVTCSCGRNISKRDLKEGFYYLKPVKDCCNETLNKAKIEDYYNGGMISSFRKNGWKK